MNRIVLLDGLNDQAMGLSGMVVEALSELGWQTVLAHHPAELTYGDVILVLGYGNWARVGRPFLEKAGELGIQRILWNFEPLLPPDLPPTKLLDWYLSSKSLSHDRRPSALQRLFDRITYLGLTRHSQALSWNQDRSFPTRQISYPAKESRRLLQLWREGLIDTVYVSLRPRQAFLEKHGVPSAFIPFGYHPSWGTVLPEIERDIEVVFMGHVSQRRRPLLESLQNALTKAGHRLLVVSGNCYGMDRTRLLNRTKILLNLNKLPWELPGMRMLMAMGCKTMVVSEFINDSAPYIEGQHFLMAQNADLVELVVSCLSNEGMRTRIADQGYRYVTREHTLATSLKTIFGSPP